MATQTSNDVANEALQYVGGNQPPVQGQAPTFDNSTAGKALQRFYTPVVQSVARQFGWDFARCVVALALSGNPGQMGYALEYLYPSNGVEIWQLMPTPPLADVNNPLPITWTVYNTLVAAVQTKAI